MLEKFVIITGTPGTGKTTVTKLLSEKGWISYDITSFVKEKSLFLGYDIIRDSLIIDEFHYSEEMQFPLLNSYDGVALERIDYNIPANEGSLLLTSLVVC